MHRSTKFVENQTELKFDDQEEPKAKKNRSDDRITNIATMDNGTLVEAFKSLNYCQLAKNSLVSKKFWNLIQTNRHRLALLYVDSIRMVRVDHSSRACVQVFDKQFSSEEYNEWVIRYNYSKQIPLQDQVAGIQSIQDERKVYELCVDGLYYKDPRHRQWDNVFFTRKELNHENWPLFEHFVRLVTDPGIYICSMEMAYQSDVLSLVALSISPNRNRLKCDKLMINPEFDSQKFMSWIKDHVLCGKFQIYDSSCDEELLDFFMTGASCTSEISLRYYDLSNVILDFVQKFMELKKFDENQIVQSIKSNRAHKVIEVMKRNYAQFIVKDEEDEEEETALTIFEFINSDVGEKMEITLETTENDSDDDDDDIDTYFSLEIKNL